VEDISFILLAGVLILLFFFWSAFRERVRILKQVRDEILETGLPAGPLPGPAPHLFGVASFLTGAAALFPLAGIPFAAAAFVLAPLARREAGDDPGLAPTHALASAGIALAVGGVLVNGMVLVHLLSGAPAFEPTRFLPETRPAEGERPLSMPTLATAVVILVMSAVFHECAHGLVAYWSGDDTARKAGRLTVNPLPHLDPFGSFLLPVLLVVMDAPFIIGWAKPVPVRLERLRDRRWGQAAVSSAGVGINFTGVLFFFALFVAFGILVQVLTPVHIEHYTSVLQECAVAGYGFHPLAFFGQALKLGIVVNLALALFNLIPLPPLDGASLLESFLPSALGPLFASVRSLGCLLLPLIIVAALCLLLPLLLPALYLVVNVMGAFFVRM